MPLPVATKFNSSAASNKMSPSECASTLRHS
jgi:hypothetical protein